MLCMCNQSIKKNAVKSAKSDSEDKTGDRSPSSDDWRGTEDRSPSSVDQRGSSGLSKLRFLSPAASPSAGILRKRQLSTDSVTVSDQSPTSPSARVCRCLSIQFAIKQ